MEALGQAVTRLPDQDARAIAETCIKAAAAALAGLSGDEAAAVAKTCAEAVARLDDQQVAEVQKKLYPPWPPLSMIAGRQVAIARPGLQQLKQGSSRLLQLFSSLLIVAGVLAPATYQALYAASAAGEAEFAFRMLNMLSFALSLVCVLSCLVAMCFLLSVPVCQDDPPSQTDYDRLTGCLLNGTGRQLLNQLYWLSVASFVASLLVMLAVCFVGVFTLLGPFQAAGWMKRGVSLALFVVCLLLVARLLWIWQTFGGRKYYY